MRQHWYPNKKAVYDTPENVAKYYPLLQQYEAKRQQQIEVVLVIAHFLYWCRFVQICSHLLLSHQHLQAEGFQAEAEEFSF